MTSDLIQYMSILFPLVFIGLLSYIWEDIKKNRNSRDKEITAIYENLQEKYLSKPEHTLHCKNVVTELSSQIGLSVSDLTGKISLIKEQQKITFESVKDLERQQENGFSRLEALIKDSLS